MIRLTRILKRTQHAALALMLTFAQIAAPLAIVMAATSATATAAPICTVDTAGANDEPGQKDLTKLCVDYVGAPTTISTTWNWDDTGTSGNGQSLDACNLFDTDGDGNINYAVCVSTNSDPAVFQSRTTYSCGDDKIDRCTSPATPISSGTTTCGVSQSSSDPFASGAAAPVDTQGACTIQLSTVGGASARLVDVCSYPSGQPGSDPSDCVIIRDSAGKVELIKDLIPGTDSGLFNLSINGPEANDTTSVNNVGDGGTTGEVVVKDGSVIVSETPGTNTMLTSYNTTIICRDLNGTGAIVGQSTPTGTTSRQLTFTLADQADVVCIITNDRQEATLILQKTVVNDDGGTLTQTDFPVAINGATAQWGSNSVAPGSYTVSETQQPGYTAGVWGGDCAANGTVSLSDSQTKTCTITNNDIAPLLTVIKNVTNNNGGTATPGDFTMNVAGTDVSDTSFAGAVSPGTTVTLDAGNYNVTENGVAGYTGSFSADCTGSIGIGEHKTCTVTNDDDAPRLTILKSVTNDNGGTLLASNFVLHLTGGSYAGNENFGSGNTPAVNANIAYSLSEDAQFGYAQTSVGCTDDNTTNAVTHPVTLSPGQQVTCTIANNDIAPRLTVVKEVTTDDGGILAVGDFPLFVDNLQVLSGQANDFNAGTYTVSETQQPGYTLDSILGDCLPNGSITMVVGGVYTCTLTNNDQPARIMVTKNIVNDNGGASTLTDFDLFVDTTEVTSGVLNTFPANQQYVVSETSLVDGYTQTGIDCRDSITDAAVGATFTPVSGQQINCVITNNDDAPTLTLTKSVVDQSVNPANPNQWTLSATPGANTVGATTLSGDGNPADGGGVNNAPAFAAVAYTLSETGPAGFSASDWVCTAGDLSGNVLTLALDQHATCTITNTKLAELTVTKDSVPNDQQDFNFQISDQAPGDLPAPSAFIPVSFQLDDDSDVVLSNQQLTSGLQPGTYYITEDAVAGWDLTAINCGDGVNFVRVNDTTIAVTLVPGAVMNCTFTNTKRGSITVIKETNPDGSQQAFDFTASYDADGFSLSDGQSNDSGALLPGTYSVAENTPNGWDLSGVVCSDQSTPGSISLQPGENVTCTFTNTQDANIVVVKQTDPDTSPQLFSFNASYDADGYSLSDGQSNDSGDLDPGTYSVSENVPAGWDLDSATCDDDSAPASVSLQAGETVTCTFTNEQDARIVIVKQTDPDGSQQAFDFTASYDADGFSLSDGQSNDSGDLDPGIYSVSETLPLGWQQENVVCSDGSPSTAIGLAAGETVTCTFSNEQDANIVVVKETLPDGEEQAFDFTASYDADGFSLSDGQSNDSGDLDPGTYSVSENVPAGWDLDSVECSDRSNPASIVLTAGETVICTFTNAKRGSITVVKDAQPDSSQEFKFTGSLGDPDEVDGPNFTLVDDSEDNGSEQRLFADLEDGNYTVTEPNVKGWTLESITCNTQEGTNVNNRNVVISLEPGENVICTFVNTRDTADITVHKITEPADAPESFEINLRSNDEDAALVHSSNLKDGESDTYTVDTDSYTLDEENIPSGWDLAAAFCTVDEGETSFDPRSGFDVNKDEDVDCTFVNQKRATVVVTKYNDYDRDGEKDADEPTLPGWDFTLSGYNPCQDFVIDSLDSVSTLDHLICLSDIDTITQTTGADGTTTFEDVLPRRLHTLKETLQPEWTLSNIDCGEQQLPERTIFDTQEESDPYFVYPEPGETVNCFVGNYQEPLLEIAKSNNRPNPTTIGDTVTYTLHVTVPENSGAVHNTTVQDLPPENFEYLSGSWTANSSLRGDIKAAGVTTEPTYGSPGAWILGRLLPGEIVTLTYKAKIGSTVISGVYPDFAFASGCQTPAACTTSSPTVVLANVSTGSSTPFVGTQVAINTPAVLGASTTRLVDTGTADIWRNVLIAGFIILVTITMLAVTRTKKGGQS